MKKKGFYLLPIVKLLDSYKVYSIIKVDPCGEVSWNWVLRCFSCFFSAEITTRSAAIRTATPPYLRPPCVIYSHTLLCAVHPSISLSFLSLSPSVVGLLLHLSDFYLFSSRFYLFNFFCFECLRFLFVRTPPLWKP